MIRIECSTWEELIDLAGKILAKGGKAEQKEAKAEQKEAKAEQAPAQTSDPLPWDPAPAPALMPAPAPARTVSRQEVQAKAIALMDAGKKTQLQDLLKKYNVPALPSIPEAQLAAFMADMEAM